MSWQEQAIKLQIQRQRFKAASALTDGRFEKYGQYGKRLAQEDTQGPAQS